MIHGGHRWITFSRLHVFFYAAIDVLTAQLVRTAEEHTMTEKLQDSTEPEDSMAAILMKIFGLGVGCIVAAWGIIKLLEKF